MNPLKLVLDTSVFVNPDSANAFGLGPTAAFTRFLLLAQKTQGLDFLMPPSIYAELLYFVEGPKISIELLSQIQQQPPKKHELKVPAIFVYELVASMRDRIDRGLRLAERHVREAFAATPAPVPAPGEAKIRPDAEAIGRLRETYRRIMREGALDSKADVDLLLLAYETGATLVSADQGVVAWAENLGVRLLPHPQLPEVLARHTPH